MNRYSEGQSYYDLSELSTRKKGKDWYVVENKFESVMFVEATKNSSYKQNVQRLVKKHNLKIRIVERAGQTLKTVLQRSDPFRKNICSREDCFICENGIPINCRERGVVYQLSCTVCLTRMYRGQTSRSEFERLKEHLDDLDNEKPGTPLFRHKELFHPDGEFSIDVKILSKCFGKPSRRMITEAVLIGELKDENTMNSKTEWTYTRLNKL